MIRNIDLQANIDHSFPFNPIPPADVLQLFLPGNQHNAGDFELMCHTDVDTTLDQLLSQ